jgi:probable F420-dependent oxidoreductase
MANVKFSMAVPQNFLDGRVDMELVRRSLQRGEELGYDGAWVQDQVTGEASLLESISLLCYAAAVTTTMKLGVSVIVFPIRNAVQLAKSIGTLDHMSDGRVILGLGLGPPKQAGDFFLSFGMTYDQRLRRFNEGLQVMKSLWTEPKSDLDGEFYTLKGTAMEPKPVQKPHPPVWIGGQHPNALRRSVRHGDGYMGAGPISTQNFAKHVQQIRHFLDEEGRDPATFPLSKRIYVAVDDRPERAKARLDEFFAARYPWQLEIRPDYVAETCVWGTPEQCVDGLNEAVAAGAGMILVNPLWDYVEQMEVLAEEVFPQVS